MGPTGTPVDRRIQRTRELLFDSLRRQMALRGYERLTIQHLLDDSGVGRATFYSHFDSKDALLTESVTGLRHWLTRTSAARADERLAFTLSFFEHLESHVAIYRMTVRRGELTVGRQIRLMLRDLIREDLTRHGSLPADATAAVLTTEYLVGALWSTVAWWMGSETRLPAADVDRSFRRLVFAGLSAAGEGAR